MEKRSPFRQLLKVIENEAYDFELRLKCHEVDELNIEFAKGYRSAINNILLQAVAIYNRGLKGEDSRLLFLDLGDKETTEKLLARFKKEG